MERRFDKMLKQIAIAGAIIVTAASRATTTPASDAPHFSLSPAALYTAATAPQVPPGTNVSLLEMQERFEFDAQGQSVYTQYMVYKILSPAGVEDWGEVSIGWDPWLSERPSIRARVISADGREYELDRATITDTPARQSDANVYSDRHVLTAPLPAIAPGAVIEQEIVLKEAAAFVGAGTSGRTFLQMSVPIQHARMSLAAPSDSPLQFELNALPGFAPVRSESAGRVNWQFDHGPAVGIEDTESGLPPDSYPYPAVTYSTGRSWKVVAQAYSRIIDDKISAGGADAETQKVIRHASTRDQKIHAIVEFLNKEIRYTGIEFGEANIVPHSPAEVLRHKYGDCKDKSTLLVAMLRSAGIPASIALLNVGETLDVPAKLPGMSLFNHAIAYIPGDPALWVDATDEYSRVGQVPSADQGRMALIANESTDSLVAVSELPSSANRLVEIRRVFLAENGPARVVEISQPEGIFESAYRSAYEDVGNKKTRENLTDYMKNQYVAENLDRVERSDPKDFTKSFQIELESKRARRGFTDLSEANVYIRRENIFYELPSDLKEREATDQENAKATKPKKKRVADYLLPKPFAVHWQYEIVPPAGFEPAALPVDATVALGPATLTEHYFADPNGTVHADLQFDTKKRRLSVAEQIELKNKVADLSDSEPARIKFELSAELLSSKGKIQESFQAYRNLIALHPKEAVHHLQRATALLQAGMGEAARMEARAAVALEPKSALAQKTLANVLEHDLNGRWRREGADREGAIRAYRAAAALDADDKASLANLAIRMEYNSQGIRYGEGSDLLGAVETYGKLTKEERADLDIANNLAYALFYQGEIAAARKRALELNSPPTALLVACEAMTNGAASALTEARRRTNGEPGFKKVVTGAAQMVLNRREYSIAADLMEAGAAGTSTADTMGMVTVLRKAKRHDQTDLRDTPEDLVRKVFLDSVEENLTREKLAAHLSREAQQVFRKIDPVRLERQLEQAKFAQLSIRRSGLQPGAMLDIVLQMIQLKSEGSDETGFRVGLLLPTMPKQTFFIVKEEGHYKILDSADSPDALGAEVLARLARGDRRGAYVLLDWLREDQHAEGGDDRFAGRVFPRFWTRGKSDASDMQIRLAAAAIMAESAATANEAIPILQAGSAAASNDTEREEIDFALMIAYETLKQPADSLPLASELLGKAPTSKRVFVGEITSLLALNRFSDADQLALARLKMLPSDLDALRARATVLLQQGEYAAAFEMTRKITEANGAEARDFNDLAWQSILYDRPQGPDIDSAIKAAQLNPKSPAYLHTLACVYARSGKTKESREVLFQAMDLKGIEEPNGDYWFAFGALAEQYGETGIALTDYSKVTPPADARLMTISTFKMAQARIKALRASGGSKRN